MKQLKQVLFDFAVMTFGCLLIMAGPLLQAFGFIKG
jgi:hypothetical protein